MNNFISSHTYLLERITKLCKEKDRAVIAIDGRAASGKTTLSSAIAELTCGTVVHTDDFFLPLNMRSPERLSQPGGNIHYERLRYEVIDKLGASFDYGVYNCSSGTVERRVSVCGNGPVIIEGAYSTSPVFGKYYDLSIFVTASYDVRISRILARDGELKTAVFKDRWIPLEESYISAYRVDENANIIIDTTDTLL